MCDKTDCINKIKDISPFLKDEYGVRAMTLFGSTARGTNADGSDVDLFVDMAPSGLKIVTLKLYLENLLGNKVDLVRNHSQIDSFFLKEVARDGIRIF